MTCLSSAIRTAGEVMVPRVMLTGIAVGTSRDELQTIVQTNVHTRYPVYSGSLDNIIGSLHIKQVLRHLVADRPVTARDARPLPYVPGPMPLDEVLAAMRRYRAQMAVVMDQHGGTAGLVTMEDLFEEVVGDIEEAHGPMSIVHLAPGRIRARGTVRLQEAGEALGCNLEHPKVTTISGLVLTLLGRPTTVGDTVIWQNARIEVTAVAGTRRGRGGAYADCSTRCVTVRPKHRREMADERLLHVGDGYAAAENASERRDAAIGRYRTERSSRNRRGRC